MWLVRHPRLLAYVRGCVPACVAVSDTELCDAARCAAAHPDLIAVDRFVRNVPSILEKKLNRALTLTGRSATLVATAMYYCIDVVVHRLREGKAGGTADEAALSVLTCILDSKHLFYRGSRRPPSHGVTTIGPNAKEVLVHCAARFKEAGGWEMLLARLGDAEAARHVKQCATALQKAAKAAAASGPVGTADDPLGGLSVGNTAAAAAPAPARSDAGASDDAHAATAHAVAGPWVGYCESAKLLTMICKAKRSVPLPLRARAIATFVAAVQRQDAKKRQPQSPAEEVRAC